MPAPSLIPRRPFGRTLVAVTELQPAPHRVLEREVDEETRTGEPHQAHIVKTEPGESAAAKVLEARIYGTPLEALCGHRWIPSRDPKQLPLCATCKEIYEMYRAMNEHLGESPQI